MGGCHSICGRYATHLGGILPPTSASSGIPPTVTSPVQGGGSGGCGGVRFSPEPCQTSPPRHAAVIPSESHTEGGGSSEPPAQPQGGGYPIQTSGYNQGGGPKGVIDQDGRNHQPEISIFLFGGDACHAFSYFWEEGGKLSPPCSEPTPGEWGEVYFRDHGHILFSHLRV